jgi:hypothetical protein
VVPVLSSNFKSSIPTSERLHRDRLGQQLSAARHEGTICVPATSNSISRRWRRADLRLVASVFGYEGGDVAGLANGASCALDLLDPCVWPSWLCGDGHLCVPLTFFEEPLRGHYGEPSHFRSHEFHYSHEVHTRCCCGCNAERWGGTRRRGIPWKVVGR